MRRRNPHSGLVVFWVKLMQRGYKRSIPGLYRFLKKQGILAQKLPNPKYIPKPYEQMKYPGQRIQVDVKFVPACCLVNNAKGKKFYRIPPLMSTPAGGMWKLLKNTAPIHPHSSSSIWSNAFLCQSNAFRQTTAWSLQSAFPLPAKKHWLYSNGL